MLGEDTFQSKKEQLAADNVTVLQNDPLTLTFPRCAILSSRRIMHLGYSSMKAALDELKIKYTENDGRAPGKRVDLANPFQLVLEDLNSQSKQTLYQHYEKQKSIYQDLDNFSKTLQSVLQRVVPGDEKAVCLHPGSKTMPGIQVRVEFPPPLNDQSSISYQSLKAALKAEGIRYSEGFHANYPFIVINAGQGEHRNKIKSEQLKEALLRSYLGQRPEQMRDLKHKGFEVEEGYDERIRQNLEQIPKAFVEILSKAQPKVHYSVKNDGLITKIQFNNRENISTLESFQTMKVALNDLGLPFSDDREGNLFINAKEVYSPSTFSRDLSNAYLQEKHRHAAAKVKILQRLQNTMLSAMETPHIKLELIEKPDFFIQIRHSEDDQISMGQSKAMKLTLESFNIQYAASQNDKALWKVDASISLPEDFEKEFNGRYHDILTKVDQASEFEATINSALDAANMNATEKDSVDISIRNKATRIHFSFPSFRVMRFETTIYQDAMRESLIDIFGDDSVKPLQHGRGITIEFDSNKMSLSDFGTQLSDFGTQLSGLYLAKVNEKKQQHNLKDTEEQFKQSIANAKNIPDLCNIIRAYSGDIKGSSNKPIPKEILIEGLQKVENEFKNKTISDGATDTMLAGCGVTGNLGIRAKAVQLINHPVEDTVKLKSGRLGGNK